MKISKFNFPHLIEILEFLIESERRSVQVTVQTTIQYFKKSSGYTQSCLALLELVRLIEVTSGFIKLNSLSLDKGSSRLIEEAVLSFQPFVEYIHFLGKGKSPEESTALVKHLYKVENPNNGLVEIFQSMQKKLGMLKIIPAAKESLVDEAGTFEDLALATLYIKNTLGAYYHELPGEIIKDFISAIQAAVTAPSKAVNDAGRGLEDFFRLVLVEDIDLKKRDGLGQISIALNENQTSYPSKLNNLLSGLAAIRSMGDAHGADKKILERWVLSPESARAFISLSLNMMKGYLTYKDTKKLTC